MGNVGAMKTEFPQNQPPFLATLQMSFSQTSCLDER